MDKRYKKTALALSVLFGRRGIDRLYLGYIWTGILKRLIGRRAYLWYIVDILNIAENRLVDRRGNELLRKSEKPAAKTRKRRRERKAQIPENAPLPEPETNRRKHRRLRICSGCRRRNRQNKGGESA